LPDEADADDGTREECPTCGRKFRPAALDRHSRVCTKVFVKKRKAFDSTAARMPAEALAKGPGGGGAAGGRRRRGGPAGRGRPPPSSSSSSSAAAAAKAKAWKAKSSALRDAMKASRMIAQAEKEGRDIRELDLPTTAPDTSLVPCPHCGRTFNATAADRHIPRCATTKARPKRLARGAGGGAWKRS